MQQARPEARRVLFFLWLLVVIALASSAIVAGLMGWTLLDLRSQRTELLAQEKNLSQTSLQLKELVVKGWQEINALLDVEKRIEPTLTSKAIEELQKVSRLLREESTTEKDRGIAGKLEEKFSALAETWQRASVWRSRFELVLDDEEHGRSLNEVRRHVHTMRAAVEAIEGKGRLQQALRFKRYQQSESEEAAHLAHAIVKDFLSITGAGLNNIKTELADIAHLTEVLANENQLDHLDDLKDNKLQPSLDRLSRSLFGLKNSQADDALGPASVEKLMISLFGIGYEMHQAHQHIHIGKGGLYALRLDKLKLLTEHEALHHAVDDLMVEIEFSQNQYAQLVQQRIQVLNRQVEERLSAGWKQMLWLLAVTAAIFLTLAWRITKGVHRQVNVLASLRHRTDQLLSSVGEGVYGLDPEGRTIFVNPAATRILGWDSADLLDKYQHDIIHHAKADGSQYPMEECPVHAALQDGLAHHGEEEHFFHKDGTCVPIEFVCTPMHDHEGRLEGAVLTFRDISERKRAEEAVIKERDTAQRYLDLAPVMFVSIDTEGKVILINKKGCEVLGYDEEDILGKDWFDNFLPKRLRDEVKPISLKLLTGETEAIEYFENPVLTRGGEERVIAWHNTILRNETGKIIGHLSSGEDISERKKAEERAQKSHETTRRILESLPVGVAIIGRDKVVRNVNKAGLRMMGRSAEQVVGEVCHEHICPALCDQCPVCDLGQTVDSSEKILLGPNKEKIPILKTVIAMTLEEEEVLLEAFVDITDQKQAEVALREARHKAEDASRAKSEFLANMSHEIRTPMNAVIGLTYLALQTELDLKQKGYLTSIESSANSLLGIINDILDFSKIEAGQLEMEEIPFRLSGVMDNLANVASVNAEDKDIEVLFNVSDDTPAWLKGDPLRLGQVLINLTNNAIKFTEKGEVVVSSELVKQDEEQITLQFSIKDTGIGMSLEQQEKLFQAFSQADSSTTRRFGGTGLGLSICKRLVEMMDGEISVKSEAGRGSVFSFNVRMGSQEPLEAEKIPEQEALQGLRVLVVDDNPTARVIMEDMLVNIGAEPTLAASGQEALDNISQGIDSGKRPYDVVLMDWKMPEMDGLETSRRLKAMKALPGMPTIIMVTAYGQQHVRRQAADAPLDGILSKPVTPQLLIDILHQALDREKAPKSGEQRAVSPLRAGLRGKRILLVEDNPVNQQVAAEILKGAGILVEVAENGVQAVQRVKDASHPYDLILMDVMMPEMDGLEATRRIRADMNKEELPIISMTASVMQDDLNACYAAGMNDIVAKPVDVERLFVTLRKWLPTEAGAVAEPEGQDTPLKEGLKEALPESLAGVDLQDALHRFDGNTVLLRKLLLDFRHNSLTTCDKIRQAMEQEDLGKAHHLSHDIKGVAGNLGIKKVYAAGQALERAIKQKETEGFERLFESLRQEVAAVVIALEKLGEEQGDPAPPSPQRAGAPLDRNALAGKLTALSKMLRTNNMNAGKVFEELKQDLAEAHVEGLLAEVGSRIGKLDFKEADKLLNELCRELKISINEGT